MKPLIIRASSLGDIMAPAKKAGELSAGAKTFIRKAFKESLFGYRDIVSTKPMQKGIQCEQESIDLLNAVQGTAYVKNTERRTFEDMLTGECDIDAGDSIGDVKSSWSLGTFPIWPDEAENTGYEWQLRAYMLLWDRPAAWVAYCMVNTPEALIGYENREMHIVDHIPADMRVTRVDHKRDAEKESAMIERIKLAQAYYSQLENDYFGF